MPYSASQLLELIRELEVLDPRPDQILTILRQVKPDPRLDQVLTTLQQLEKMIMASEADFMAALKKINDSTNAMGGVLTAEAASLQTISTNLTALVAQLQSVPQIPDDAMAAATTAAANIQAISDSITQQAAFAASVASQG